MGVCHFCGSLAGTDDAGRCKTCGGLPRTTAEEPRQANTRKISNSQRQQVARTRSKMWRAAGAPGSGWVVDQKQNHRPAGFWDYVPLIPLFVGVAPILLVILFLVAAMFCNIWGYRLQDAYNVWEYSGTINAVLLTMCLGGGILFIFLITVLGVSSDSSSRSS